MDFERAIDTQRHRLLRLVAGLLVLVGFLSVGPVSRGFSDWVCRYVGPRLSRSEAAARYLLIAHARRTAARCGDAIDHDQFADCIASVRVADDADISLSACRSRLWALRALLMNLPQQAARLLRRMESLGRRPVRVDRIARIVDAEISAALHDWRLVGARIERPPDTAFQVIDLLAKRSAFSLPSETRREAKAFERLEGRKAFLPI